MFGKTNSVQSTNSDEIFLTSRLPYIPVKTWVAIWKKHNRCTVVPFTYKFTHMHVLEIQMMSGDLKGCIGCISYSTVVVYMFNYMTCPKCSVCTPLCFSGAFYSVLKCFPLVFITENRWIRRAGKNYSGFCGKHRMCSLRLLLNAEMIKCLCLKTRSKLVILLLGDTKSCHNI